MRNLEAERLERQSKTILQDMKAIVAGDGPLTEEKRHAFDKARLQLETINLDIEAAKRDYSHTPPPMDDPSGGVIFGKTHAEARSKFERYIRTGKREQRDLTSGATPGPEFIPQEFYPVLTEAQKAWGPIIQELNIKNTPTGAPMKVAFSTDVTNLLHESGEPAVIAETDTTLTSVILNTDIFDTGVIKVTVQELQDSAFDVGAFIGENFGRRFYRGLTAKVTNGSTSGNVQKLLNATQTVVTAGAGGTTIDYDDLVSLWSALDPAYLPNAIWSMNNATKAVLLKVKDTLGRPLYVPAPTADQFDTLLGKRVVLNQSAPNVGSAVVGPIQFGDFRQGYLLRQVRPDGEGPGLAIVRLNERYMDTLEVGFIGYARVGGLITDAGTHPIETLKMAT